MTIKIKHKRGTASNITSANPTLAAGELAFETDTRRFKVGDGTTAWSSLSYVTPYVTATDRILGRSSAGAGSAEEITCTAAGRALLSGADAAAQRTTLSVQPTASPAFTGAATVSSGNIGVSTSVGSAPANGTAHALLLTSTTTAAVNVGPAVFFKGQTGNNTADYGFAGIQGVKDSSSSQNYAGALVFFVQTGGGGTALSEAMRCRTDHSTGAVLTVMAGQLQVTAGSGSSGSYKPGIAVSGDDDTGLQQVGGANTISLVTAGSERVRVDASGNVLVGTTNTDPSFNNVSGVAIGTNYISMSRDNVCFGINRSGTDGDIAVIRQDGVTEGSISVSGNTVSYNAFCGSHWAQLIDGSRPAILRGTVLETIDEMCEWPGEPKNDRLPRVKVSDTPRSRRVYGVFMAWDEDYASTGDMYATALGAYMVRVSGVVQSGDLLESAGDGTARTQSDDIVRSSTIGKVSSTHRVAEYDDGSYLVPCVLMCG